MREGAGGETAEQELGAQLRSMRRARGLSQGELARRAGVNDSTVSRWESGKFTPAIPELEAVLTALGAESWERRTVLQAFDAPRALRRLREVAGAAAPPVSGDLLWAIRLRKGWTQSQAAQAVGVSQTQITRWERGETWPDAAKLHALCWHLNAHPDEVAALDHPSARQTDLAPPADRAAWLYYLNRIMHEDAPSDDLLDVTLIGVEARLARLSAQHDFAAELLPLAYTIHARHHHDKGRSKQAAQYAERSLALVRRRPIAPIPEIGGAYWMASAIILAMHDTQKRIPARSRRAYHQLRWWLDQLPPSDLHYSWGLSEVGRCLEVTRNTDEGVRLSQAAIAHARTVSHVEEYYRRRQHIRLLLDANRPTQALRALDETDSFITSHYFRGQSIGALHLMRSEGLLALDLRHEADETLRQAMNLLPSQEMAPWHNQITRLSEQL